MRGIIGLLTAIASLSVGVAGAQANLVYTKGDKIYTAGNSGQGAKQIALGDAAIISPDGLSVIYTNSTDTIFRVPFAGGPSLTPAPATKWCVKCGLRFAPDSKSLLLTGEKRELDYVPLDGTPVVRLAAKIYSQANYAPDSKQVVYDVESPTDYSVFTTPVAGGVPVKLPAAFATAPVWTTAGIVASTIVAKSGRKYEFRIVLLNAAGGVKRVLQRKTVKNFRRASGLQDAYWPAGANVLTFALGKKSSSIVRLVSTANGKVKSKLTFSKNELVWAANPSGTTLVVIGRKGKLMSVNIKSGKRKTLVKSGVNSVDISG